MPEQSLRKPEKSWNGLDMVVEYTDEIVCPWCGHEHSDSWEKVYDEGETGCRSCGKRFSYLRAIDVTYSTSRELTEAEKSGGDSSV